MSSRKFTPATLATLATTTVALLGSGVGTAAHARSGADVQWSVTVGAPVITLPAPVLRLPVPPVVVVAPHRQVVHYPQRADRDLRDDRGYRGYREPTRWDVDGDGIPNRHDRRYNPVWDRNGNGVPDRREHHPHGHHGVYGDRDHDGIPNRYDRRDDRWDPRGDRHHDRRDGRDWREPHSR